MENLIKSNGSVLTIGSNGNPAVETCVRELKDSIKNQLAVSKEISSLEDDLRLEDIEDE